MSDSPWTTRFELWAQKTKLLERPEPNIYQLQAMERGKKLEGPAREWYERRTGFVVEADVNCEHEKHSFLRASLDGWVETEKRNVEIKSPGKEDLRKAKDGEVPEKYWAQVQMQMLIAGATSTDFVVFAGKDSGYFDGDDAVVIPVAPDPDYQALLESELVNFWKLVETRTPPAVGPKDLVKVVDAMAKLYERMTKTMEALKLLATVFQVNQGDALDSWANKRALKE